MTMRTMWANLSGMRRVEITQWSGPRRRSNSIQRRVMSNDELREFVQNAYDNRVETYVSDLESGEEIGAVTRDTFGGRKKAVWLWWSE